MTARSRRVSAAQTVPMMPSGTLNQKTHCQPKAVSAPPMIGPRIAPTATIIWLVPMAKPSSWRGKASVTMALELAIRKAPPTPCKARSAISSGTLEVKPASSEVSVNTAKPSTYSFLRPTMSDRRPTFSTKTVWVTL